MPRRASVVALVAMLALVLLTLPVRAVSSPLQFSDDGRTWSSTSPSAILGTGEVLVPGSAATGDLGRAGVRARDHRRAPRRRAHAAAAAHPARRPLRHHSARPGDHARARRERSSRPSPRPRCGSLRTRPAGQHRRTESDDQLPRRDRRPGTGRGDPSASRGRRQHEYAAPYSRSRRRLSRLRSADCWRLREHRHRRKRRGNSRRP